MSTKRKMNMTTEGKVKMLLSVLLLVFALIVSGICKNIFIFFAMFFSSMGDFAIASSRGAIYREKKSKSDFYTGVSAFAFAHLVYVISMLHFKIEMPVFIKIIIGILAVSSFIAYFMGETNNEHCTIPYAICLLSTCCVAFKFSIITGIGYILFLVSDLILALFEEKNQKWQYAIWGTYVPAQAVILTSFLLK